MLGMARESTRNALERAFPRLGKGGTAMSRQAFSKARQKIKWEALEEPFRANVEGSRAEGLKLWRGYRVMAADGTSLSLPSDAALLEHFGDALASLLCDTENDVIVDASTGPISGNERDMAFGHVDRLPGMESHAGMRELVVFDRGYPSGEFVKSLRDKEMAFVMCVRKGFLPGSSARDVEAAMRKGGPLERAALFALATSEEETLVTSLPES